MPERTDKPLRIVIALAALVLLMPASCRLAGPAAPGRPVAPSGPAPGGEQWGAVNVPATVLWSEPGQLREYDGLILQEKNDPAAWAAGMDVEMRLWLVGRAETMALYGEPVVILEQRDGWLKVAAAEQRTTLNQYGYPGWVPAAHIARSEVYLAERRSLPAVLVMKKTAGLYADPELTVALGGVSYMTRLPLLEEREGAVAVRLPGGGTGYLAREDVKKAGELTFSRSGIVDQARQFLELPYLWAGTSAYGFDCSGFTMRLYQSQGIAIPRDADEQAREGLAVARRDLLPGDLVFFAAKGGRGQIHHVGMYAGGGMMIHAPNSGSRVRVEAVDGGAYGEEYWGARRYAP
ncbi:MAG: C40 family peptidase [Peptococcaceae bacterium]|nr:C40 family peptidase [Peptococcaceae bacterium]